MIYKTPSPKPNHVRVTFELPASLWAHQVFLVGDFNGWGPATLPSLWPIPSPVLQRAVDMKRRNSHHAHHRDPI